MYGRIIEGSFLDVIVTAEWLDEDVIGDNCFSCGDDGSNDVYALLQLWPAFQDVGTLGWDIHYNRQQASINH